ncbi:MAG: PcfJ domain-containing protein [Pseudaminobacter sp.]
MSSQSWFHLKDVASRRLVAACARIEERPAQLSDFATIVALAEIRMTVRAIDGRLDADIRTTPSVKKDSLAVGLVQMIAEIATDHASSPRPESSPSFGDWVEKHGFSDMSIALLSSDANWQDLTSAAEVIATAIKTLSERSRALAQTHMGNILARDLPEGVFPRHGLGAVAAWLLAPETNGGEERAVVLTRRRQAMTVYGVLSGTLRADDVTGIIDAGLPLAPVLMERHGLSAAELRSLRNGRHLRHSIESPTDFHVAIEELKTHETPLHEWPGGGRPGEANAWAGSPWVKEPRQHVVRPDYFGFYKDGITDAINAMREDLLRPLVAERVRLGGFAPSRHVVSFARSIEVDIRKGGGLVRQRMIAALRHAIIGARKPKAFQQAVGLWHRRVATLSALRHEHTAERPGWPDLCAPWRSACGSYQLVVLSSAADLVEEGRVLDHCVGGYYAICRRGDTQILSMRENGNRIATLELTLGPDLTVLALAVGQFKACPSSEHLAQIGA